MAHAFDRSTEDLGNIVAFEHVNIRVPDQRLATAFYLSGMGFTRDPYRMNGIENMWVNFGRSQFHLPTGAPQVLRGHVGLVVPDREALLARLALVKSDLADTKFDYVEQDSFVAVTSPWGNKLRCFEPSTKTGPINLGLAYVEFDVPTGSSGAIARFYEEIVGARAKALSDERGEFAHCSVGNHQQFLFRETDGPIPEYEGDHVAIYIADFSGPNRRLSKHNLVSEESNRWQYRFKDIIDPDSGTVVYTMEHEVRSMTHPMYMRPLVNRIPNPPDLGFAMANEGFVWATPYSD